MDLDPGLTERLFAALAAAGLPEVPREFSVVPQHQIVPAATLAEIARFIEVFDQATTRETWQAAALRDAPAVARMRRPEICFFSAWDFHLPPHGSCQLIEFNDNGYRGKIFNNSGRASRRLDRLDLAPPGGWLPTYAALPVATSRTPGSATTTSSTANK